MLRNQDDVDILSFELEDFHTEQRWTTERIFQHFGVPDASPVRPSPQLIGGVRFIRCGPHARRWLDSVLEALEADPWLFSDRYNQESEDPAFDNRHDQSIMSVAAKLKGGLVIKDETYPPGQARFPIWAARNKA